MRTTILDRDSGLPNPSGPEPMSCTARRTFFFKVMDPHKDPNDNSEHTAQKKAHLPASGICPTFGRLGCSEATHHARLQARYCGLVQSFSLTVGKAQAPGKYYNTPSGSIGSGAPGSLLPFLPGSLLLGSQSRTLTQPRLNVLSRLSAPPRT